MQTTIQGHLSINRIFFSNTPSKELVIDELIRVSKEDGKVGDVKSFKNALQKREAIMSTGIGYGVAIPHVKLAMIQEFFITICVHKNGVDWESLDNKPAHLIFLIAGPENQQETYLRILAKLTSVIKNPERRSHLLGFNTKYDVFKEFEGQ